MTLTATVTGSGATLTGSVTFFAGLTSLGSAPLDSSGHASLTTLSLGLGTSTITAFYNGNPSFATSTGAANLAVQPVAPATTTTTLATTPASPTVGQPVTITATVTGGRPTGSVAFLDGSTTLGTVPLDASGVATLTTSNLGAAEHHHRQLFGVRRVRDQHRDDDPDRRPVCNHDPDRRLAHNNDLRPARDLHGDGHAGPGDGGHPPAWSSSRWSPPSAESPRPSTSGPPRSTPQGSPPCQPRLTPPTARPNTISATYQGDGTFATSTGTSNFEVGVSPFDGGPPQPTAPPPTALLPIAPSVATLQRFGYHNLPTVLKLTFTGPLYQPSAVNKANYRITDPSGHVVGIQSIAYDPTSFTVTIKPSHRLNIHQTYHLRVIGAAAWLDRDRWLAAQRLGSVGDQLPRRDQPRPWSCRRS